MEVIGVRGLAGVRMPVLKSRRKYSSIYITIVSHTWAHKELAHRLSVFRNQTSPKYPSNITL